VSFPLVGNLSKKEGFWTSQNDIIAHKDVVLLCELLLMNMEE
jgi:hypothetical protein